MITPNAVDQNFVEIVVDKIMDGIAEASTDPATGTSQLRPVENLVALQNIMVVTLAAFPPQLDHQVNDYIANFAAAMRVAIAENRRLRDLPIPANSN